jgi:hypothetical protein
MINPPKTIEEARARRYGKWKGNLLGFRYHEGDCAYECHPRTWMYSQCSRKNGHGIAGLYCKQHAEMMKRMEK